jgi:hypothetical protein
LINQICSLTYTPRLDMSCTCTYFCPAPSVTAQVPTVLPLSRTTNSFWCHANHPSFPLARPANRPRPSRGCSFERPYAHSSHHRLLHCRGPSTSFPMSIHHPWHPRTFRFIQAPPPTEGIGPWRGEDLGLAQPCPRQRE